MIQYTVRSLHTGSGAVRLTALMDVQYKLSYNDTAIKLFRNLRSFHTVAYVLYPLSVLYRMLQFSTVTARQLVKH